MPLALFAYLPRRIAPRKNRASKDGIRAERTSGVSRGSGNKRVMASRPRVISYFAAALQHQHRKQVAGGSYRRAGRSTNTAPASGAVGAAKTNKWTTWQTVTAYFAWLGKACALALRRVSAYRRAGSITRIAGRKTTAVLQRRLRKHRNSLPAAHRALWRAASRIVLRETRCCLNAHNSTYLRAAALRWRAARSCVVAASPRSAAQNLKGLRGVCAIAIYLLLASSWQIAYAHATCARFCELSFVSGGRGMDIRFQPDNLVTSCSSFHYTSCTLRMGAGAAPSTSRASTYRCGMANNQRQTRHAGRVGGGAGVTLAPLSPSFPFSSRGIKRRQHAG